MSLIPLVDCLFLVEDDLEYLKNDEVWLKSKLEILSEEEAIYVGGLMQQVRQLSVDLMTSRFAKRVIQDYCSHRKLKLEHKNKLKALFLSVIVRELILKLETPMEMEKARHTFLERYPALWNELGSDLELTWLNRFERAMKYLMRILSAKGNKGHYIGVGTHLQGSEVHIQYRSGGCVTQQTKRRIEMFQALTGVKPVKRSPRNNDKKTPKKRGRPRKQTIDEEQQPRYTVSSTSSDSEENEEEDEEEEAEELEEMLVVEEPPERTQRDDEDYDYVFGSLGFSDDGLPPLINPSTEK
jgi:hypothetical protein